MGKDSRRRARRRGRSQLCRQRACPRGLLAMPWSATSRRFATIGVMLASALLSAACTRNADDSPTVSSGQAKPASFASSNDQDPYRYLYTVYCNGTVDRLDLVQRSKVGSFQLSERSGSPPAVAALAQPGVRPGGCLADRKSTRLNSSHTVISYAVFCL